MTFRPGFQPTDPGSLWPSFQARVPIDAVAMCRTVYEAATGRGPANQPGWSAVLPFRPWARARIAAEPRAAPAGGQRGRLAAMSPLLRSRGLLPIALPLLLLMGCAGSPPPAWTYH